MRISSLIVALVITTLLAGCQTYTAAPEPPGDYAELAERAQAGEHVSPQALRAAFLASDEFNARMQDLAPLERQAMQMLVDEPLRLGAIGSAILGRYYGSLIGHHALQRFYAHLGASDEESEHRRWAAGITQAIESSADGSADSPYPVVSANEADVFLRLREMYPVGSMYYSTEDVPFMVLVAAQNNQGKVENVYFDLTGAYLAIKSEIDDADEEDDAFGPGVLIGYLAQQDDSAAQVSIGSYLFSQARYDEAAQWFMAARQTGNVLAEIMLGQVFQLEAQQLAGDDRERALELALEHYSHAIAAGSDDAMFALGALYLDGQYGSENVPSGVALLRQAAESGNTGAMLWLGHLHTDGTHVARDLAAAEQLFRTAAENGSARGKVQYARFLANHTSEREFDPQARRWLVELAEDDHPEAMLMLGNLHAKGVGVRQNFRRSQNWYKNAVRTAPDDAEIVNEVAWTLTVSHLPRLRDPRYALEIMEHVMSVDPAAREHPAYLDTWAAAHAANGDFERALELQRDAVDAARTTGATDILDILEKHLRLFEQGETITDEIP
jgi:TPR repeat protein